MHVVFCVSCFQDCHHSRDLKEDRRSSWERESSENMEMHVRNCKFKSSRKRQQRAARGEKTEEFKAREGVTEIRTEM